MIGAVYILMNRRTTELYNAIWQFLRQRLPDFNVRNFTSDFEIALVNALRENFPNARIIGCWFHLIKVLFQTNKNHLCWFLKKVLNTNWIENNYFFQILHYIKQAICAKWKSLGLDELEDTMLLDMCLALPLLPYENSMRRENQLWLQVSIFDHYTQSYKLL